MLFTRVTTRALHDNVLQSVYQNQSKLNDLQQQISTGKRVDSTSDDPSAAIDILKANSDLNKTAIYNQNVDYAVSETETTDKILSSVTDTIQRIKELTLQASNATSGPTELESIRSEIEQLSLTLKDAGNTKFGDKYIFAGAAIETVPFEANEATGEMLYNGTPSSGDYKRSVEISKGVEIDVNLSGEDIFGYYKLIPPVLPAVDPTVDGKGLFNTITTLKQELAKDPADYDAIRSKIDGLDSSLDTVINARAKIGGVAMRLDMTKSKLGDDEISYTKVKAAAEDIDMVKVISDLSFQETAYKASLQVSAKIIQPSLLSYMS